MVGKLAVVIGRTARRVSESDALSYVLGYACGNDVSERVIQRAEMKQGTVLVGKGFDTFCPLGPAIARLVTTFRPYGFALTAPVFEHLDLPQLLDEEVREDLAHGLVGKTAIHPDQVDAIERHYRVDAVELAAARAILDPSSPAVFRMHGSMCEVATHRQWAQCTIQRSLDFGSNGASADGAPRAPVTCATDGHTQPATSA